MKFHRPKNHSGAERRGFALVVTLTLMVLLSILALGLLSLASVELKTTGQQEAALQAAPTPGSLFPLPLAAAKRNGPDQRISAPGGQLLDAGDKSARNHWTGVYEFLAGG